MILTNKAIFNFICINFYPHLTSFQPYFIFMQDIYQSTEVLLDGS